MSGSVTECSRFDGFYRVAAKEVYNILANFDKMYDEMTDPEKKEFYRILIDKIEVHEDRDNKSDGIIKRVVFNIPVFINGQKGNDVTLTKNCTVETVALIEQIKNAKGTRI